jgi:hypothetical protein
LEGGDFPVGAQHEEAVEAGIGLEPTLSREHPLGVASKNRSTSAQITMGRQLRVVPNLCGQSTSLHIISGLLADSFREAP